MEKLPEAFAGLARFRQFIVHRDKTPIHPQTMLPLSPVDPNNWMDFDTAAAAAALIPQGGIGFVFTPQDPFFFLDIDKCLVDGQWSERANEMLNAFEGAGVEVSQSGQGLHIIGTGLTASHACKNKAEGMELYTEFRFVALTGSWASGNVDHNCQRALDWLVENFFDKPEVTDSGEEWRHTAVDEWNGPWDDDILISKAMSAVSGGSVFGGRASFKELFEADVDALAAAYPETGGKARAFDESSADMALAQHLAFWTGKNHERMRTIMLRSALVRDKWDREDYLVRTIQNACMLQTQVYSVNYRLDTKTTAPVLAAPRDPAVPTGNAGLPATGGTTHAPGMHYMTAQEQPEYFRGCVYIRSLHRVLIPDGSLLKPDQFRVTYGGYNFCMDNSNSKTSKSAWEAFTESQAFRFPKAHHHVFRPELPPLKIFEEEGVTVVNSYVPIDTARRKGNPEPFLDFLIRILPNEYDREILLCYMASMVQHPGKKFQWAPILQGIEGNGKTTVSRVMAFCVGRRYSHFPNAQDIANKFNSWLAEKLFIGVEEIYVGDRQEVLQTLYPMITQAEDYEIQRKGQDQEKIDNRANFILTTNHKDAVRIADDTRRWCMLYTAQQEASDLARFGLDGLYFPNLYQWLNAEGYEIMNDYLREFTINEELDPAGACVRAPASSSIVEARQASMGSIEQEIQEALGMDIPGFRGGWISSIKLDEVLQSKHLARYVPRNKRRKLLNHLGYDWHPSLVGGHGRTNTPVMQEGGKPVLFYRMDLKVTAFDPASARAQYIQAQGYPAETVEV